MTKKKIFLAIAIFSLSLLLSNCGGPSASGKWEVSILTPFFGGRPILTTVTLESDQVFNEQGIMIGTYKVESHEGDDYLSMDFTIKAGGISGVDLGGGKFIDSTTVEGGWVTLKRKSFGDTLKGKSWKANKVE